MKTPTSVALALVLLLAGCSSKHDTPVKSSSPVFDSPSGPVTLVSLSRDEDQRIIEAQVLVSNSRRHIILKPLEDAPYEIGFCAEITDAHHGALFRMEFAWDLGHPNAMWMQEETDWDELTLSITHTEDRTTEEYNINGDSFFVDYPTVDEELRQSILSNCMQGEPLAQATPEEVELAEQFAKFQEYYSGHANNTLHNNNNGELLAYLVNDKEFVDYVTGGDRLSTRAYSVTARPKPAELICAIAGACSFKCYFGGLANPLCAPCIGVSVACVIATIACWIVDCGP